MFFFGGGGCYISRKKGLSWRWFMFIVVFVLLSKYTKTGCPGLQRRHVFVESMASSTHLSPFANIRSNMDPKKIDGFFRSRNSPFPPWGLFVGDGVLIYGLLWGESWSTTYCSKVMVQSQPAGWSSSGSPDGFCNLCNSPKGEEEDAQKNEQHLSAGFILANSFLGTGHLRKKTLPGLLRNCRTEALKYRPPSFFSKAGKFDNINHASAVPSWDPKIKVGASDSNQSINPSLSAPSLPLQLPKWRKCQSVETHLPAQLCRGGLGLRQRLSIPKEDLLEKLSVKQPP